MFEQEIRDLANQCFDRHRAMSRRDLSSDTPNANSAARSLAMTGFHAAIRDARRCDNDALADHLMAVLAQMPRDRPYVWLNGLACDGREPIESAVEARNAA
jgi:hypothetical protein